MTVFLVRAASRYNINCDPGCHKWKRSLTSYWDLSWSRGVETHRVPGKGAATFVRFKNPTEDIGRHPFSNRTPPHREEAWYRSIDSVPWEIHGIEGDIPYEAALRSYLKSTEITIGVEAGVLDWPPFRLISECSGAARKKLPKSWTLPRKAVLRFPTGEHMKYEIVAWAR